MTKLRPLACVLGLIGVARGAIAPDEQKLTVSPAAPPTPALQYQFRFERAELTPGNAATDYVQADAALPSREEQDALWDADANTHDDDFVAAVRQKFPNLDTQVPPLIASAVRRETCEWDVDLRRDGLLVKLPQLNRSRAMANYLAEKARLASATGDYKQAVELLRSIAKLADDVDRPTHDSVVITALVAIGIDAVWIEQAEHLVQRPDAPNLYWALRALPPESVRVAEGVRNERSIWGLNLPTLVKAWQGETLTADEWREAMTGLRNQIAATLGKNDPPLPDDAAFEADMNADLVIARPDYARRRNLKPEAVEAMEPAAVVGAFYFDTGRDAWDDMVKDFGLPYPQALPALAAAFDRLERTRTAQPNNPFLRLIGSEGRALQAAARLDRRIAASTTIEAVRAYAAAHDGHWPAALADVVDTPAPDNPVTGKPFAYVVDGDTAEISDPGDAIDQPLDYTLRLRH